MQFQKQVRAWNLSVKYNNKLFKNIIKSAHLGIPAGQVLYTFDDEKFIGYEIFEDRVPKSIRQLIKELPKLLTMANTFDIEEANEGEKLFLATILVTTNMILFMLEVAVTRVQNDDYVETQDEYWLDYHLKNLGVTEQAFATVLTNTIKFIKTHNTIEGLDFTAEEIRRMRITIIKAFKI